MGMYAAMLGDLEVYGVVSPPPDFDTRDVNSSIHGKYE